MSFFPRSVTPSTASPANHPLNDSHVSLSSTPASVNHTPLLGGAPFNSNSNVNVGQPSSSTSAYALASSSAAADGLDIPITRSRTLYYLSVRDSSTTRARSRRYLPSASTTAGYGGFMGEGRTEEGEEETAGLIGGSSSGGGREGDWTVDLQRPGLPPRW